VTYLELLWVKFFLANLMSTSKKRIQAYVNDATYYLLQDYAQSCGISVSEAASRLLQTHLGSIASSPSKPSMEKPSEDYLTKDEFDAFKTSLAAELGRMEGRYQAYCESINLHVLAGFETAMKQLSPGADTKLLESPVTTPPESKSESPVRKTRAKKV
jgi:hypothetical protein